MDNKFRAILTKIYTEPHGITLIKGNWKTGKTDFALHLYEILKDMKLIHEAGGNIQIYKDQECLIKSSDIAYIDNFQHLKAWMFRNLNRKLFFFDEAMKSAPSKKAMTLLNAEWQRIIPELSKGKVHLIAITQEESMTEKIFMHRTFNVATWNKIMLPPSNPQYRKIVTVSSKLLKENLRFRNINKTNIIFNPYLSANWSLEPTNKSGSIENTLELKVAYMYSQGIATNKIIQQLPIVKDRKEATRLIQKGLKMLFSKWQVSESSSGYSEQEISH